MPEFNINQYANSIPSNYDPATKTYAEATDPSRSYNINYKKIEKLLGPNLSIEGTNIPKELHEAQSVGSQLVNSLNQAIVGEVAGGTLEGLGYLFDMQQYGDLVSGTEQEFGNGLSDIGKALKTWTKESTPIYSDPESVGQFRPDQFSWWATNFPSVASTLSLLIPATGVTKGLSMLGKYTKLTANLGKEASWLANGITQAVVSRHMENLMESSQVYDQLFNDYINKGYGFEQARDIASKGAAKSYSMNWAMLAQDIPEYLIIGKLPKQKLVTGVEKELEKRGLSNALSAARYEKLSDIGKVFASEGFEEGYQYVVGEEAKRIGDLTAGIDDGTDFGERLNKYLEQGNMWTSAFFGALGGASNVAIGRPVMNAIMNLKGIKTEDDLRIDEIKERGAKIARFSELYNAAFENEDTGAIDAVVDETMIGLVTGAKNVGNDIEKIKEELSLTLKDSKGYDADVTNNKIDSISKIYDTVKAEKHSELLLPNIVRNRFLINKYKERLSQQDEVINNTKESLPLIDKLSETGKRILDLSTEINSVKENKRFLKVYDKLANPTKESKEYYTAQGKVLDDLHEALKTELDEVKSEQRSKKQKIQDDNILKNSNVKKLEKAKLIKAQIETNLGKLSKELESLEDRKFQDKIEKAYKENSVKVKKGFVRNKIESALTPEEIDEATSHVDEDTGEITAQTILDRIDKEYKEAPLDLNTRYDTAPVLFKSEINDLNIKAQKSSMNPKSVLRLKEVSKDVATFKEFTSNLDNESVELQNFIKDYYNIIFETKESQEKYPGTEDIQITEHSEGSQVEESISTRSEVGSSGVRFPYPRFKFDNNNKPFRNEGSKNPIPVKEYEGIPVDRTYVDDPNTLSKGTELKYEVDLDQVLHNEYHKKLKGEEFIDNFAILLVSYEDGKRHVVAPVPAYNNKIDVSVKQLRNDIADIIKKSVKRNGILDTNITTKVANKSKGTIWNVDVYNNPIDILRKDEQLIFGIGYQRIGNDTYIEANNADQEGIYAAKFLGGTTGGIYQYILTSDGEVIPARLFTKGLKDVPSAYSRVKDNLANINKKNFYEFHKAINEDVHVKFTLTKGGEFKVKGEKDVMDLATMIEYLETKPVQVSWKKINSGSIRPGEDDYNTMICKEGRIVTDINPIEHTHSSYVEVEKYNPIPVVINKTSSAIKVGQTVKLKDSKKDYKVAKIDGNNIELETANKGLTRTVKSSDILTDKQVSESNRRATIPDKANVDNKLNEMGFGSLEEVNEALQFINNNKKENTPTPEESEELFKDLKPIDLSKINKDAPVVSKGKYKLGKPNTNLRLQENALFNFDKKRGEQWLKENLPQVELNKISSIYNRFGKKGLGAFYNAAIYIGRNGKESTYYHEAFHAVFTMFLSKEQQDEFLKDYTEEQLSVEFEKYKLTKLKDKSWSDKLFKFFVDLWNHIKVFFNKGKPMSIEQLFNAIDNGEYKTFPIANNFFSQDVIKFQLDNFTPKEAEMRVDMIIHLMKDKLDEVRESDPKFKDAENYAIIRAYSPKWLFSSAYNELYSMYEASEGETKNKLAYTLNDLISNIDPDNFRVGSLGEVVSRNMDRLGVNIKVKADKVDRIDDSVEDDEINVQGEETTGIESWAIDVKQKSGKSTLSRVLKDKLLSNLRVSFDESGNDDIGFPRYLNADAVYNTLKSQMSDLLDIDEMTDKLKQLSVIYPHYDQVIDLLNSDNQLKTLFFVDFSKTHALYTFILQNNNGEIKTLNSNRLSLENFITDEWKKDIEYTTLINKDGSFNKSEGIKVASKFEKIYLSIQKAKEITDEQYNDFSSILTDIGVFNSVNELKGLDIKQVKALNSSLNNVINRFKNGINIFNDEEPELRSIRNIGKLIGNIRNHLFEASFRNIKNKNVYSHIMSFYLSKQIMQFKKDNALVDKYLQDDFYKYNIWLNRLKDPNVKQFYEYTILNGLQLNDKYGTEFKEFSKNEFDLVNIHMYYNNGRDLSYYKIPSLSDADNALYLQFERYTIDDIVNNFYLVAKQEQYRIDRVKDRQKNIAKEKLINNYDYRGDFDFSKARGLKFLYLPYLNNSGLNILTQEEEVKKIIRDQLESGFEKEYKRLEKAGLLSKLSKDIKNKVKLDKKAFLKEYYYNTKFAKTQIIQLTSKDLAFYKNSVDFVKRNKQIYSPGLRGDIKAVYTDKRGRKHGVNPVYNVVYLNDSKPASTEAFINELSAGLKEHGFTDNEISSVVSKFKSNNESDGQGIIRAERAKQINISFGRWNDTLESQLNNGEIVINPMKPFMFTDKITEDNVIYPVQHKNSEEVLFSQLAYATDDRGNYKYPILRKLLSFMDGDNKLGEKGKGVIIDSIQFVSTVKVGITGSVDFDNIDNAVVHKFNSEDYMLQQETPEHHLDHDIILGLQMRRLLLGDIDPENVYHIDGMKDSIKGSDLINLAEEILSADVEEDYNALIDKFNNIEDLQSLLLEEVKRRKLGENFEEALDIVEINGKKRFKMPLFHKLHAKKNEELIHSLFNNHVITRKQKGAQLVQLSSFGLSDKLHIQYKDVDGKKAVDYYEVMLPYWSREYFDDFMNEDGNIDISKIKDQRILDVIGYYIPTESKYSILPLRIVGFLPENMGGSTILPKEMTTITGKDFDIDKLYVLINETNDKFEKIDYDYNKSVISNSKQQRVNAKLDIYRAVLNNPAHLPDQLIPGGGTRLVNRANKIRLMSEGISLDKLDKMTSTQIKEKIDELDANIDLTEPSVEADIFDRNMSGAALIGPFAVHNLNHALAQIIDLKSLKVPVIFNNVKTYDFGAQKALDNKRLISRNLSTFLAAIIDNGKEPVASEINLNLYTADIYALLVRSGHDIETITAFMRQPILKDFVERYLSSNGGQVAENLTFGEKFGAYESIIRDKISKEFDFSKEYGVHNFKLKELEQNIVDQNLPSDKKKGDYYLQQYRVLQTFRVYNDMAKELGKIVRAMRPDSKGAGPRFSQTIEAIENYESLDKLTYFGFNLERAKSLKSFQTKGIVGARNMLARYFPFDNDIFKLVRGKVLIKNSKLRRDEIDYVNYEFLGYLASEYPLFDLNDERRSYLIKQLPKRIEELKRKDAYFAQNDFVKRLFYRRSNPFEVPVDRLVFTNTGSMTGQEKTAIVSGYKDLLNKDEYKDIAQDLIQYDYAVNGFNFGVNNTGHLVPVEFYHTYRANGQSIAEFLYNLLDSDDVQSEQLVTDFLDQFYRNNRDKGRFIPEIDTLKFSNISEVEYKDKKPFQIKLDPSIVKSRSLVYHIDKDGIPTYFDFIKGIFGNKTYLFKRQTLQNTLNTTYEVVEPLGLLNYVKEYNINDNELRSILGFNNPSIKGSKVTEVSKSKNSIEELLGGDLSDYQDLINQNKDDIASFGTDIEDLLKNTNLLEVKESASSVYSKLGNKTQSENIVIKQIYQEKGVEYAKSINGVFSLRVNDLSKHFGNPFSSDKALVKRDNLIQTSSTRESVERYIDWVLNSNELRAKWIREQLQSGILKNKKIVYYKELNEPSHATALDYLINKYSWNNVETVASFALESSDTRQRINALDNSMKVFLSGIGVKIESYNSLKERFGNNVISASDTLNKILYVANGKTKLSTLPEEAAHFAVELYKEQGLVQRALNLLSQDDYYKEILGNEYSEYEEKYEGDLDRLKREALGKLIKEVIIDKSVKPKSFIENILNYIWNKLMNLFGKVNVNTIEREVKKIAGTIGQDVVNKDLTRFMVDPLSGAKTYFQIDNEDTQVIKDAIEKIVQILGNKITVLEAKGKLSQAQEERVILREILKEAGNKKELLGIVYFIDAIEKELTKTGGVADKIISAKEQLVKDKDLNLQQLATNIKGIYNYTAAYTPIVKDLISLFKTDLRHDSSSKKISDKLSSILSEISNIESEYYKLGSYVLAKSIEPFLGDMKGKIDLLKMIREREGDITFFQRWLDSLGEAHDDILKLINELVGHHKDYARHSSLDAKKQLLDARNKYVKESGSRDLEFIYSHSGGKINGHLVTKFDTVQFEDAIKEQKAKTYTKLGLNVNNPKDVEFLYSSTQLEHDYNEMMAKWFEENTQSNPDAEKIIERAKRSLTEEEFKLWYNKNVGENIFDETYYKYQLALPSDKYLSKEYANFNPAQKEFVNTIISVKENLDELLPINVGKYSLAPQLRKEFIERVKQDPSLTQFKEYLGDLVFIREDENERGNILKDEQGNVINLLPTYYTRPINNPNTNLSLDIIEGMAIYADMVHNYDQMNKIVDILEISKDIIKSRTVYELDNQGKPIIQNINQVGKKIQSKLKKTDTTFVYDRLVDFINMNVYGQYKKDQGKMFGKLDKAKTLDLFGRYVAINNLALNVYAGIANPIMGRMMISIEAAAKEFYSHKDVMWADKTYASEVLGAMSDIGNINPHNKLFLWMEYFDVLQDYEQELREIDSHRKTKFGQMMKTSNLFVLNHMGEHWVQTLSSLAMANTVKLKDKNGNEINLWEAYEVKGNKLVLKNGIVKLDGTEWTETDRTAFNRKQNFVNNSLQGIYNRLDRSAVQQYAEGRLALMFRKFIKPGWNRRFEKTHFIYQANVEREGYYYTVWKLITNINKELDGGKYSIVKNWQNLKPYQKRNIMRASTEVAFVLAVASLAYILNNLSGDDDKDWKLNMLAYEVNRIYTELRFYSSPNSFLTIMKSPAAGVDALQDLSNFVSMVLKPYKWTETIERGKYSGYNRLERSAVDVIPMYKTVTDVAWPEEKNKFFKLNR